MGHYSRRQDSKSFWRLRRLVGEGFDLIHQLRILLADSQQVALDALEVIDGYATLLLVYLGLVVSSRLLLHADLPHRRYELVKSEERKR